MTILECCLIKLRPYMLCFLPILQQFVVLNLMFIVKFPDALVVVYVPASLMNKDQYFFVTVRAGTAYRKI